MKKALFIAVAALLGTIGMTVSAQDKANCPKHGNCNSAAECQAGNMNKMRQPREFTEFAFEGVLLDIDQQTRIDSLNAAVKSSLPECKRDMKDCPMQGKCDKQACPKDGKCDKKDCPMQGKCDKQACPKDGKCDKKDCPKDGKCDKQACPKDGKCDKKDCPKDGKCDKQCKKGDKKAPNCDANHKFNGADRKAMHHRGMNPYGPEYIAKVQEILTPEQFAIFMSNIEKMGPAREIPGVKQFKGDKSMKMKGDRGQMRKKGDREMKAKKTTTNK